MTEIDDGAARLIDLKETRRLIQLEVSELDLELWQSAAKVKRNTPLFFRIGVVSDAALSIELWNRGAFYGERRVSTVGDAPFRARQLSLAAVELAREVQKHYRRELVRQRELTRRRNQQGQRQLGLPLWASLRALPEFTAVLADSSTNLLVGPRLGLGLAFQQGPRIDVGSSLLLGSVDSGVGDRTWRSAEVLLAPAYSFRYSRIELDLGASAAAATVALGAIERQAIGQKTHWFARAGGVMRLRYKVSSAARLSLSFDAALPLRAPRLGPDSRLQGVWLGLGLGVEWSLMGVDVPTARAAAEID